MPPFRQRTRNEPLLGKAGLRLCFAALALGYAGVFLHFVSGHLGSPPEEPPRKLLTSAELGNELVPPLRPALAPLHAPAFEPAFEPARREERPHDNVPGPVSEAAQAAVARVGVLRHGGAQAAPAAPPPASPVAGPTDAAPPQTPSLAARGRGGGAAGPQRSAKPKSKPRSVADKVVARALLALAELAPRRLEGALNTTHGTDFFGLAALERGGCPSGELKWLPERGPQEPAARFRNRATAGAQGGRAVMVWYEHLSKAGGTSFCKLAGKNMKRKEVPSYYCMPSEPGMPDARVGQWSNAKLQAYHARTGELLVSNEWEPFPLERLEMQSVAKQPFANGGGGGGTRGGAASGLDEPLDLVLVTSIRDPLNRLVSAWKFWGVLHNPNKQSPPPAGRWLRNMEARARQDAQSSRGLGKGPGSGRDFIARVGQANFATWKFSGGTLPTPPAAPPAGKAKDEVDFGSWEWRPAFERAVLTLCRFDLAIPMELLSGQPGPVEGLLGWRDFSVTHVVPSGKVVNTDAAQVLGRDFRRFWDANRLDLVLHAWCKAVYLARLNCGV